MRTLLVLVVSMFITFQFSFAGDEGKIYGKGISLKDTTKISDILALSLIHISEPTRPY